RRRRGDEERPVVVAAPGEIRRALRHVDDLEQAGVGVEDVDAARATAVDVAGGVELHPVGRPGLVAFRLGPEAPVRERASGADVEHADVLARGVVDEEAGLVQREAEAVRAIEVVDEQLARLRIGADPVDPLERQLLGPLDAVELGASVRRVAEVDPTVAPTHDIVRTVQLLAEVVGGDRYDPSVALAAAYQSEGGTSSNTTHTASRGSLHTSEIVSVTRRAISSLRSFPWPS